MGQEVRAWSPGSGEAGAVGSLLTTIQNAAGPLPPKLLGSFFREGGMQGGAGDTQEGCIGGLGEEEAQALGQAVGPELVPRSVWPQFPSLQRAAAWGQL